MFIVGFLMTDLAIAMIVAAFVLPDDARLGLLAGAAAVGLSGVILMALNFPSREKPPEGKVKADAYIIDAKLSGEATGFRMIEMTLDVRPREGVPFQVTRKFVADIPRVEAGQKIAVYYDPVNPERVELA